MLWNLTMEQSIILTGDGSHTIVVPGMHVSYHSKHGAIQESEHIFINAGLKKILEKKMILPYLKWDSVRD